MQRVIQLLCRGLAVCALTVSTAWAHGAVAIGGNPAEAATKGIAVGESHNYRTKEEARARALQECQDYPDAPAETTALCEVLDDYSHEWLSIALDPEPSTPGFGWAIAKTQESAERNAMNQCKASSSSARKPFCKIGLSSFDGTP